MTKPLEKLSLGEFNPRSAINPKRESSKEGMLNALSVDYEYLNQSSIDAFNAFVTDYRNFTRSTPQASPKLSALANKQRLSGHAAYKVQATNWMMRWADVARHAMNPLAPITLQRLGMLEQYHQYANYVVARKSDLLHMLCVVSCAQAALQRDYDRAGDEVQHKFWFKVTQRREIKRRALLASYRQILRRWITELKKEQKQVETALLLVLEADAKQHYCNNDNATNHVYSQLQKAGLFHRHQQAIRRDRTLLEEEPTFSTIAHSLQEYGSEDINCNFQRLMRQRATRSANIALIAIQHSTETILVPKAMRSFIPVKKPFFSAARKRYQYYKSTSQLLSIVQACEVLSCNQAAAQQLNEASLRVFMDTRQQLARFMQQEQVTLKSLSPTGIGRFFHTKMMDFCQAALAQLQQLQHERHQRQYGMCIAMVAEYRKILWQYAQNPVSVTTLLPSKSVVKQVEGFLSAVRKESCEHEQCEFLSSRLQTLTQLHELRAILEIVTDRDGQENIPRIVSAIRKLKTHSGDPSHSITLAIQFIEQHIDQTDNASIHQQLQQCLDDHHAQITPTMGGTLTVKNEEHERSSPVNEVEAHVEKILTAIVVGKQVIANFEQVLRSIYQLYQNARQPRMPETRMTRAVEDAYVHLQQKSSEAQTEQQALFTQTFHVIVSSHVVLVDENKIHDANGGNCYATFTCRTNVSGLCSI